MINHIEAQLQGLSTHYIGNAADGEDIIFSSELIELSEDIKKLLHTYFLTHFKEPEYYQFTFSSDELELNPIYNFVANVFDDPSSLHEHSVKIARHLHNHSSHPFIKPGELYVVYFDDILIDDEMVAAIGIFKSENKDVFLKLDTSSKQFGLSSETGTNIGKLDKGCLIFNTDRDTGFKMVNIDHSNRYKEAKYWRDDFLIIEPKVNDYHQTKNYIQLTKNFIKDRMSKEFDTDKAEEASVMAQSQHYFKNNESFKADEYETRVFKDERVVEAFQDYKEEYKNIRQTPLLDKFDISEQAVKKQSRVFKSVIKLDKNFHIYVHGDKDKIAKGEDANGRKYYILYYENED